MEDLKRRLREAAAAHEPDRDGMLRRVRQGIAADTRPTLRRPAGSLSWPCVALAALATAAVLLAGGYAAVGTAPSGPDGRAPAAPPTPPPAVDGSAPPPRTQDGPLGSDGEVDPGGNPYWSQSSITLRTGVPLGALTLEVRIAQTGGVAPTGAWRTRPEGDFTLTTADGDGGAVVYRWTLKPGRTVPPGQHVFAVQYNHAQGPRAAAADAYTATAATAEGRQHTVAGPFRAPAG
ncbi:hypothetical protein ACIO7M_13120 [Streptomyces toxytricini]|uniref:Uncharacterized protein n=1 Tax=Streptomyces toxytricini TaxID=67369 RepID=A0ABW8EJ93_STRT5